MSSNTFLPLLAFCLLFSLTSLDVIMAGRIIPPSAPSTVTRPLVLSEAQAYAIMKPPFNHKLPNVPQGRTVKDCLPKGFRHNSAPSRFVNYKPQGSGGCSEMHSKTP